MICINKGSDFYFFLPYTLASKNNTPIYTNSSLDLFEKIKGRVLIVEDDSFNFQYLKEILSKTAIEVIHTEYGKTAVDIALMQDIDLVLMDIRLPDIEGYEAIQKIKEHKPNLKIIAQTAYASDLDRQKALNVGCVDYLSKPIKRDLLLSKINQLLG